MVSKPVGPRRRLLLLLPLLLGMGSDAAAPAPAPPAAAGSTAPPSSAASSSLGHCRCSCFVPAPRPPLPRHRRTRLARRSATAGPAAATAALDDAPEVVFQRWFRGQFDNVGQVREERAQGMGPGEEGGHEQIHCVLEPLPALQRGLLGGGERFLGATYYFDDKPEAVFRCRVYSFHAPPPPSGEEQEQDGGASPPGLPNPPFAEMRLHRFTPAFEAGLRAGGYDLQRLLRQEDVERGAALEELEGCSILWAVGVDRRREGGGLSFRGVMRHGFCEVGSQREAGIRLKIEDDLLLTEAELSVNDRGFDCATGRLVYGNHRGVPYRMARRKW